MNKITNNATEILESLDFNSLNIIEKMYEIYQSNPQKLDQKWATIFQSLSKQISKHLQPDKGPGQMSHPDTIQSSCNKKV